MRSKRAPKNLINIDFKNLTKSGILAIIFLSMLAALIFWNTLLEFWLFLTTDTLPKDITDKPQYEFSLPDEESNIALNQPMGIAVDRGRNIYVADTYNHRIVVFHPDGRFAYSFGERMQDGKSLAYPYGIVVTGDNDIIIADNGNKNVVKYDRRGQFIKELIGPNQNIVPGNMIMDKNGNIYLADLKGNRIIVLDERGRIIKKISPEDGSLFTQSLAMDKENYFWIADSRANILRKMDGYGRYLRILTGKNELYDNFTFPGGIAVDNLDRLIVCDTLAGMIRFFNNDGVELFRLGGREDSIFLYPISLTIDKKGYLYILDRGNNKVHIWGYNYKK